MNNAWVRFDGLVTRDEWHEFCAMYEIVHKPELAGGNVYQHGRRTGVECAFGNGTRGENASAQAPETAEHVSFQTAFSKEDLARIAGAFWVRFGGAMYADEQVRELICGRARAHA